MGKLSGQPPPEFTRKLDNFIQNLQFQPASAQIAPNTSRRVQEEQKEQ